MCNLLSRAVPIRRGHGLGAVAIGTAPRRAGRWLHDYFVPSGGEMRCWCAEAHSRLSDHGEAHGSLPPMADSSTQSIVIDAPVSRVAAVICDFARYPEWTDALKNVEVLEEYEDGYARQVRFVLDAGILTDEYTLIYEYAEDISRIEWHLAAPSRVQKSQRGA